MAESRFHVGFGEADITPSKPVRLAGYYYDRVSTAVHDRLCARSMAISDGTRSVVVCVADLIHVTDEIVARTRQEVRKRCGLPPQNLMLSAVHTHTAPDVNRETAYAATLPSRIAQSVQRALKKLAPASICAGRGEEEGLQFIRRFRMRDGSVRTNPGKLNPDILSPIGVPDPALQVLFACGDRGKLGGLFHYALHCDTVGGTRISADWTHYLRERLRKGLGAEFSVLTPIGPCGDINHWDVTQKASLRGFPEARRIGHRVAHAAIRTWLQSCKPIPPGKLVALRESIAFPTRKSTSAELAQAREILSRPAEKGVDFTLERVEARRRTRIAEIGKAVRCDIAVIAFGNVALVGIPAEYFTELGRSIKGRSPFENTFVIELANGNVGYVGEKRNYEEGGYEMTSSILQPGGGEKMADTAVKLLKSAHRRARA